MIFSSPLKADERATATTPTISAAIPPASMASRPGVIWTRSPNNTIPSAIPASGSPAAMAGSEACSGAAPKHPGEENTAMSAKVALVTGGSSGIGEATALKLAELGYPTYAAARRVQRMEHLTKAGIRPLAMDVTDVESMQAAVKHIIADEDWIDVLVNGAGYGSTAR